MNFPRYMQGEGKEKNSESVCMVREGKKHELSDTGLHYMTVEEMTPDN